MSYKVESICDCRKFGNATRKQLAMYLANKASDDGSGIWCSKYTMSRHTELSLSTVKRTIREFVKEGILAVTEERRLCNHGHTIVYRLNLAVIAELEILTSAMQRFDTGVTAPPVSGSPPSQAMVPPRPGSVWPPNHPWNNSENLPTRECTREELKKFDDLWDAYPQDRRRDRATTLHLVREALSEVSMDDLLSAVRLYASESAGFTRSTVSFSDNWFRYRKWPRYVAAASEKSRSRAALVDSCLSKVVDWIKSRHDLCRVIPAKQVRAAIERGLVSVSEAEDAGFGPDGRRV
ncbi:hypothetical protein [Paenirhodobacter enshiensis]|uniref:hypothetical protein n=1 Tax=Paenirhodobacter enshiensis TaxID=1105367 RepID=UPI0035AEA579